MGATILWVSTSVIVTAWSMFMWAQEYEKRVRYEQWINEVLGNEEAAQTDTHTQDKRGLTPVGNRVRRLGLRTLVLLRRITRITGA